MTSNLCEACGEFEDPVCRYCLGASLTLECFLTYSGAARDIHKARVCSKCFDGGADYTVVREKIRHRSSVPPCAACGAPSCMSRVGDEYYMHGDEKVYLCEIEWTRPSSDVLADIKRRSEQLALREQVVQKAVDSKERLDSVNAPSFDEFKGWVNSRLGPALPPGYRIVCDFFGPCTARKYGFFVLSESGLQVYADIRPAAPDVVTFAPELAARYVNDYYVARCREPKRKWVR